MHLFNECIKLNAQVENINIFRKIVEIWKCIDMEDTWTALLGYVHTQRLKEVKRQTN